MSTTPHWSVTGPHPSGRSEYWVWTAVSDRTSVGGQAATKERAVELAENAFREMSPQPLDLRHLRSV